ncbi:hypothetical protein U9M48_026834 [Paspalum notatum var. saurae]|uniref:Reverse transcriptase domain-containing protein n=1 Tax=Paspalum notatum var. saurae TaxID=547442 RepID=A0AAQ3TTB9_PASNO
MVGVNQDKLTVKEVRQGTRYQCVTVEDVNSAVKWNLLNVYGPVRDEEKQGFLEEIKGAIEQIGDMMIVGGDFNLIRSAEDKSNDRVKVKWMQAFDDFVGDCELRELSRVGCTYTWSNNQTNPVRVVLDRVFVGSGWETLFPLVSLQGLIRVGSDHNPLLVRTEEGEHSRNNVFRFEPAWLLQKGFREEVKSKWPIRRQKYILDYWHKVSEGLRKFMRGWSANVDGEKRRKKQALCFNIQSLDRKADEMGLTEAEWSDRYRMEKEILGIYEQEEVSWQKRGGENWLLKEDANTGYFHGIANGRKRKYLIKLLVDEERMCLTETEDLKKYIIGFYKKLFGSERKPRIGLGDNIWRDRGKVREEQNSMLNKQFSMEELEEAVKDMKTNTASGPDGWSVGFFKIFWPELRKDFLEMLNELHEGSLDLARLNYGVFGVITLIPKVKGATNIKQFRPICLLNVIYKIITKVLTIRLTKVTASVISESQTAFILGRNILDGVVIVHEVIHHLKKQKKAGIILKLGFEKAYDKVDWTFLEEVLKLKNFDSRWIEWMIRVVEGGRVSVNLNGQRGEFFKSYKGLRQGDPLSPMLFNLIGDALAEILRTARDKKVLHGLVPDLVEGGLTHLQYTDDTILFLENTEIEIRNMKFLLFCYEEMSGIRINYAKSEVFTVGIGDREGDDIAKVFNCKKGTFPIKYLGIPIGDRRLSKEEMSEPVRKVEKG